MVGNEVTGVKIHMIDKSNAESLPAKAQAAFELVLKDVLAISRNTETPIVIWRDGKVVKISAAEFAAERSSKQDKS